jgi:hypothetical protein
MKPHKFIHLSCFLLLISTTTFSQTNGFQVLNETKVLGKNYTTGYDIVGVELKFPDRIHDFFVDTENNFLTVQLRGLKKSGKQKSAGNILQYDRNTKEILWSKAIDYDICEFLKFGKQLVFNDYNDGYGIDTYTGTNLWRVRNYIYYADLKYNIGIAYRYLEGEGYTNDFMGIDLLTSKLIWKRNINRTFGWNDFFYLNDSTFMVVAAGLHAINIQTGKGWDYNAITGHSDNSNVTAAIVGGIVGGLIGAVISGLLGGSLYYVPITSTFMNTENNIIRDVVSNVIIEDDFIYLASKNTFVKIHKEKGNIIWESTFQNDISSKSSIFIKDNTVYLVNYGFAYKNNSRIRYGKPFFAAFDLKTGQQKYGSVVSNAKEFITDYKVIENDIYLLLHNKIMRYDLTTGTKISEQLFSYETYGELQYFSDNQIFVLIKNAYFNLAQYEPTNLHVHSSKIILSIDKELYVTKLIRYNTIGSCIINYSDYQFVANDNKTFVINKDGKIIAELEVTSNAFIVDDILYDKREKSFIAIDLKQNLTNY